MVLPSGSLYSRDMADIIYAIGDVHGRDDLLGQLHARILEYHRSRYAGETGLVLHVGDYIDRGPDSAKVIDRLMKGVEGFDVICLLGNHEAMLLECLRPFNAFAWDMWLPNGGVETLASLAVSFEPGCFDSAVLRHALGKERIAWLEALPLYHVAGPYLFVHAGITPGLPLEDQDPADLLWIRRPFLDSDADHGFVVVHGHTPGNDPVVRRNRICVDTGAVFSGRLTAAVLDGHKPPVFLQAVD